MNIKTLQLDIKGMTCDHCAQVIERKLDAEGIIDKYISYNEAGAKISFDENRISSGEITDLINSIGQYKVSGSTEWQERSVDENHLVIIGGGSAAFAATIQALENGAKVTMINDGLPIGGTCVNVGCVPSKNLIRAAETLYRTKHNRFTGLKTTGHLENFKELIRQKRDLVNELRQQKYINIVKDKDNFRFIEGHAKIASHNSVIINDETISGNSILIATGARPHIPEIPGLKDVPFLTNEEAFELETLPESIIVLGGRFIALEISQMFSRLGSKVTILQRSDRILPSESPDLTDALKKFLEEEGIHIVTGNKVQNIRTESGFIVVESIVKGELKTFKAQKLVLATGRTPNTNNMGLEEAGVHLTKNGFIEVNEYLQTSVPSIFAAGDILGEQMFVYTAAYEGNLAVLNAFNETKNNRDYTAVPWVIFTDPQLAGVGLDETQANARGIEAETAVLHLSHVSRSIAARDTRGFIKLIRNTKNDQLIGARILAPEGSELLMEAAIAIKFGITIKQIKELFHPYLTLSEGLKLAAISFTKNVADLSCCAS